MSSELTFGLREVHAIERARREDAEEDEDETRESRLHFVASSRRTVLRPQRGSSQSLES